MTRAYSLKGDVTVRNESFGCLVCDTSRGCYFQYDHDAFAVLQTLDTARTQPEIVAELEARGCTIIPEELSQFLNKLDQEKLLSESEDPGQPTMVYRKAPPTNCLSAPASCTIYITDFCPKRCRHCVTRSAPTVSQFGDLTPDQWSGVFQRLRKWGVMSLVFTGGEPLAKSGIFDILRMADDLRFNITLLTDFDGFSATHGGMIRSLRHINDLQTSLDGGTAATHDFVRGEGSFRRTLGRLAVLRDSGIPFTISCAVHKRNLHEIDLVVDIYKEYRARALYLNPVAPYGRAQDEMRELLLDDGELKYLAERYRKAVHEEGVYTGNAFWETLSAEEARSPDFHPFKSSLTAMSIGASVLSISSKGECHLDSKMKSEGLLRLGNVLTDDLAHMWADPRLDKLRVTYQGGQGAFVDHSYVLTVVSEAQDQRVQ